MMAGARKPLPGWAGDGERLGVDGEETIRHLLYGTNMTLALALVRNGDAVE